MPGTIERRDELHGNAIAPDQKVRGHPQPTQLVEVRMRIAIEAVRKQIFNVRATELAGRQADVMDDQQADLGTFRSRIEIRAIGAPG